MMGRRPVWPDTETGRALPDALRLVLHTGQWPSLPYSGGIGTYSAELAYGLAERGHHVHVIARGGPVDDLRRHPGVSFEFLAPGPPQLPASLDSASFAAFAARNVLGEVRYRRSVARRLERLAASGRVDLIETPDYLGDAAWYRPWLAPTVPFVVRLHCPMAFLETVEPSAPAWVTALATRLERRVVARASHLSAPHGDAARNFRQLLALGEREIEVYPNPIRTPTLDHEPVEEEPPTVLFVGRLNRVKGADTLARAVGSVLDAHPGTRFVLIGADDGRAPGFATFADYLRSLIPEAAAGQVAFLGNQDHEAVLDAMRRASVCVFPSRYEVMSYTCLEAMNLGKAIVGSDRGGMCDLLDGGRAGLLHTPPDPADLACKIGALLARPLLRRQLGSAARSRALTAYHGSASLDAAERFYRRAVQEQRSTSPAMDHAT